MSKINEDLVLNATLVSFMSKFLAGTSVALYRNIRLTATAVFIHCVYVCQYEGMRDCKRPVHCLVTNMMLSLLYFVLCPVGFHACA